MTKTVGKALDIYIGQKRVKEHHIFEDSNLVAVKYDDNSKDEFSIRQFESVKDSQSYDDSHVPIRKWSPLVKSVLEQMLADGMSLGEKEFILERIDSSIGHNYETAICKLLGDVNHVNFINLKYVDAALRSDVKYEEKE